MNLTEKTTEVNTVFAGRIITVEHNTVELPNGAAAKREIVRHPGGVCVAAVNAAGEVAMVRQFRIPYEEVLLEVPAGKLEPGEDPLEAIKRELREEVGAVGAGWREMGLLYPSPGYCAEVIYLYACEITEMRAACPDEDEFLEGEFIPLPRLVDMVLAGEIRDAKTQALILKLNQTIFI